MKLALFTSAFLSCLAFPVFSQNTVEDPLVKPEVSISFDLVGAALTPVFSMLNEPGDKIFKPSLEVQIQFSDDFYFGLGIEYNKVNKEDLGNNFVDYEMQGFAIKPSLVFNKRDGIFYFGFGLIYGSQKEDGTVRIPSEYFNPYQQYRKQSVENYGLLFKPGMNVKLDERWSFKFEMNAVIQTHLVELHRGDDILLTRTEFVVGGSRFGLNNLGDRSFSIRGLGYLTYRF